MALALPPVESSWPAGSFLPTALSAARWAGAELPTVVSVVFEGFAPPGGGPSLFSVIKGQAITATNSTAATQAPPTINRRVPAANLDRSGDMCVFPSSTLYWRKNMDV